MRDQRFIYQICFFLLCIVILTGCSQKTDIDANVTNSDDVKKVKLEFTTDEFLEDYDTLWELLEENYIYLPILENQGVDTDSLKKTTRQQLEDRITDLDGFIYLLNNMFGKMQYFAHLGVVDANAFDVYQKYYNSEDAETNGWQTYLQNSQTQMLYEYLKSDSTMSNDEAYSFPEVATIYDEQRKTITFGMTSFDDSILERDSDFISEYLSSLGDVEIDHIIFDISGNTGGNDLYWYDNIVAPFGGTYEWCDWWYLRDTELTRNYFFDNLEPQSVSNISNHTLPDFVHTLELTHYINVEHKISNSATLAENIQKAKRWVIIDDSVYSAADSFSAFCKATGWATLVGQATHGDGQGTSPVLISLPNTGLLVRFSGVAAETSDGTLNAVTGTIPDIQIDSKRENSRDCINRLIDGWNQ